MLMASKRKTRRFGEGGDTSDSSDENLDDMSFKGAFRKKLDELGEGKTFTWKGKKYTTDTKKSGMTDAFTKDVAARKAMPEVTVTAKREKDDSKNFPKSLPKGTKDEPIQQADKEMTGALYGGEGVLALKGAGKMVGSLAEKGLSNLAKRGAAAETARQAPGIANRASMKAADQAARRAARKADANDPIKDVIKRKGFSGYKGGGKVKKYAAGGDIAPMSAMPSGKQLKENIEAQKQSEAERQARYKAVKAAAVPTAKKACGGTIKKYAKGGGIESKGKTRGKIC